MLTGCRIHFEVMVRIHTYGIKSDGQAQVAEAILSRQLQIPLFLFQPISRTHLASPMLLTISPQRLYQHDRTLSKIFHQQSHYKHSPIHPTHTNHKNFHPTSSPTIYPTSPNSISSIKSNESLARWWDIRIGSVGHQQAL